MLDVAHADKSFSFYLLPAFSLHAFSSAVEALQLANSVLGRRAYSWNTVSIDGKPVLSGCRVPVCVDGPLPIERDRTRRSNAASAVVVCGGHNYPDPHRSVEAWLRECRNSRIDLVGIGNGTIVIAQAGLAEGRRCAIHWEQLPVFSERFPRVAAAQTAYEQDGDLHTCPGGSAPLDMFVRIIERDHGALVASQVCEKSIANRIRAAGDRQRLPRHSRVRLHHKAVLKITDQMMTNLGEPVQIDELAASVGLSRRQIERLFERELGCSPCRYYLELRLEKAHLLLISSSLPVVEIAIACGFVSASHFSKVYREAYGQAPHQARLGIRNSQDSFAPGFAFRGRSTATAESGARSI